MELTNEQKDWFAERMDEGPTGIVSVPSYLIKKYRKLMHLGGSVSDGIIKSRLIAECYNT
jgi:hypothetical protein